MFISAINRRHQEKALRKTAAVYLVVSLVTITANYIYGQFGHGVHSAAMTWMFLYPLIGGTLVYILMAILPVAGSQESGYRLFSNVYNSGIATLTASSFLKGILEIAGTDSPYTPVLFMIGWGFMAAGAALFVRMQLLQRSLQGITEGDIM